MAKIELDIGEAVVITFKGTDGEITVAFVDNAVRGLTGCSFERAIQTPSGISVHVDLPDITGREGLIYHEPLGDETTDDDGVSANASVKATGVE